SGVPRLCDCWEMASAVPVSRATSARRTGICDFMSMSLTDHTSPASRQSLLGRREIASRISKNHGTHRLVIFDVTGATAQMAIERLGDSLLEIRSRHRLLRQTFEQDLTLVQKTGVAIAALKCKMLDKSLLQNGKLTVLRMAFDRADGLAVEVHRRNHTSRHGMALLPACIPHDRRTQGLARAARTPGTRSPQ